MTQIQSQPVQKSHLNYDEMFTSFEKASELTLLCKRKLEEHIAAKPANSLLKLITQNNFPIPSQKQFFFSKEAISVVSTDVSEENYRDEIKEIDLCEEKKKNFIFVLKKKSFKNEEENKKTEEMASKSEKSITGVKNKKMEKVVKIFMSFEEKSIASKTLTKKNLQKFRRMTRGLLGLLLQNPEEFKTQQSTNLALAVLFLAVKRLGIREMEFLSLISQVPEIRKRVKISSIKRSKCYSLVKEAQILG